MSLKKITNKIFSIEENVDAVVIKNEAESFIDQNFFYVTKIKDGLFEGCAVILYKNGEIDLLVSKLELDIAKKYDHNIFIYKNREEFNEILERRLKNVKNIGLNFEGITYTTYQTFNTLFSKKEITDVSNALVQTRMKKNKDEIKIIKKACNIADKVALKIPDLCKEGMYEYELAAEIDYYLGKNGAEKPAFLTISSFGKNTAKPHYSHGDYKLKKGDIILCDFGATYKKYNSDTTRTFILGKPNNKQKKMYETVINAQKKAFDEIKPGVMGKIVHKAAENYIDNTEFKGRFIHSTGHSLGLDVHDRGVGFNSECEVSLSENMVLTVEPGVYVPTIGGIRIEDDILITEKGYEILTKSNKEFIEI